MPRRVAAHCHVLLAKVVFRCQRVMRGAAQGKVRSVTAAALGKGLEVMNLEKTCFAATLASGIHVAAASAVAFVDFAASGCGDVSAGGV